MSNQTAMSKNNLLVYRYGAFLAILSGLTLFITTIYFAVIMPMFGFNFDMLDDPTLLLPWIANNPSIYIIMWGLFFCTQLFLVPFPFVIYLRFKNEQGRLAALGTLSTMLGFGAVILTLLGPITLIITSPYLANIYVTTSSIEQQEIMVHLHNVTANLGMEFRLFAEIMLGMWLVTTSLQIVYFLRQQRLGWPSAIIGVYTILVALLKVIDNSSPLEDSLGLFLAIAYFCLGSSLLRSRSTHGDQSVTTI